MKEKLSWLIFILFIVIVEWLWGWSEILAPWFNMQWHQVLSGMLLIFLSYCIRAVRLYDYFSKDARWWLTFRLVLVHNFLNNLLPARLGEISFPLMMKQYFGIEFIRSTPALFVLRLLDLHTIILIALLFWLPKSEMTALFTLGLIGYALLPVILFPIRLKARKIIIKRIDKTNSESRLRSLLQAGEKAFEGLPRNTMALIRTMLFSWLNWFLKLAVLAWFLSLFLDLAPHILVTAVIAGELTSVLPLHAPGGFGTYEAGLLSVLIPLADDQLAAKAAITTPLFLLGSSALAYVVSFFIRSANKK